MSEKKLPRASHFEPHMPGHEAKLNWLRVAVLGADDGIVSVAGLVVGVASATNSQSVILAAGLAGIIAGAISMAAGEDVSVRSERDSEQALLHKERQELRDYPNQELEELVSLYEAKGLKKETAVINPGETVRLIMQFTEYADPNNAYMFRCHILEHEDMVMMGQFVVVDKNTKAKEIYINDSSNNKASEMHMAQ